MSITIYHNPRCSKSRQTLALLQDRDIETDVVDYLQTPPDSKTLKSLLSKLNLSARQLMRTKEAAYKEAGLADPKLSESALIKAMIEHPILIERPIVVNGDKAVIGRPPENVLAIL
jgi:arsenate reductase (glutaredoxin)